MHFNYHYSVPSSMNFGVIVLILVAVILLMICFLGKQNRGKYHGFLGKLYDFLNFRSFTIATVLKFIYLFVAIFVAVGFLLTSFNNGLGGFLASLVGLILAEVIIRILFEFWLLMVVGVTNIIEINDKMGGSGDKPNFMDPDTSKYADKISKQASALKEKVKEKAEETFKGDGEKEKKDEE